MKTKSLLWAPAFPRDTVKIGLCFFVIRVRHRGKEAEGLWVVDSHDAQRESERERESHPAVSIKCAVTLCCIASPKQEKEHSAHPKKLGFGGLGTGRKDRE